jgi:hypothetical protein
MRKALRSFAGVVFAAETGIAVFEFLSRRQVVDDHRHRA